MYLHFVLAVILAIAGVAGHAPTVVPTAAHSTASSVSDDVATASVDDVAASAHDVALDEVELVVPSVDAAGDVQATAAARLDADAVVADELVAPTAAATGPTRLESDVVPADGYQTVGVTWPEGSDVAGLDGQIRTQVDGAWSGWTDLATGDAAPDAGTADSANERRGGTDSLWIGDAEAVQLSFAATATGGPTA